MPARRMALSSEAGWNQTVPDWHFMLGAGEARGQVTAAGALVASALILPYDDRIAWIGMLLTTESHRRRGLATANLRWAILRCAARGLIAGLDATPAGREVYAPLGFRGLSGGCSGCGPSGRSWRSPRTATSSGRCARTICRR